MLNVCIVAPRNIEEQGFNGVHFPAMIDNSYHCVYQIHCSCAVFLLPVGN